MKRLIAPFLVLAVLCACAPLRSPQEVSDRLSQALISAKRYAELGQQAEAIQLVHAVEKVDPEYPGLAEVRASLTGGEDLSAKPLLGSNKSMRPKAERSVAARVALYLPDRILDLLDVVSFEAHFGPGAFADVHATRGLQAAAGLRSVAGLGLHEHRSLGLQTKAEAGVNALAVGGLATAGATVGTSGVQTGSDGILGFHSPTDELYQEYRDYWAVGASVTTVLVGAEVDFHPVQVVDFLAGLLTIDFLNDDFATTRGLQMSDLDQALLVELADIKKSKKSLNAYGESKALAAQPPAGPAS
jgi:hypothetical protein